MINPYIFIHKRSQSWFYVHSLWKSQQKVSAKFFFVPIVTLTETLYFNCLGYKISLKPNLGVMLAYGVRLVAKKLLYKFSQGLMPFCRCLCKGKF